MSPGVPGMKPVAMNQPEGSVPPEPSSKPEWRSVREQWRAFGDQFEGTGESLRELTGLLRDLVRGPLATGDSAAEDEPTEWTLLGAELFEQGDIGLAIGVEGAPGLSAPLFVECRDPRVSIGYDVVTADWSESPAGVVWCRIRLLGLPSRYPESLALEIFWGNESVRVLLDLTRLEATTSPITSDHSRVFPPFNVNLPRIGNRFRDLFAILRGPVSLLLFVVFLAALGFVAWRGSVAVSRLVPSSPARALTVSLGLFLLLVIAQWLLAALGSSIGDAVGVSVRALAASDRFTSVVGLLALLLALVSSIAVVWRLPKSSSLGIVVVALVGLLGLGSAYWIRAVDPPIDAPDSPRRWSTPPWGSTGVDESSLQGTWLTLRSLLLGISKSLALVASLIVLGFGLWGLLGLFDWLFTRRSLVVILLLVLPGIYLLLSGFALIILGPWSLAWSYRSAVGGIDALRHLRPRSFWWTALVGSFVGGLIVLSASVVVTWMANSTNEWIYLVLVSLSLLLAVFGANRASGGEMWLEFKAEVLKASPLDR